MPLLIDGYNLLHVSGVFGRGTALTELHRSREALLAFLAASLSKADCATTTIVFDAAGAPPGLPRSYKYEGLQVEFARDPGNADELLERLIVAHDSPRKLVVVSSDHRVQRAAKRRRAKAIDSDRWWAELCDARRKRGGEVAAPPAKPTGSPSTFEVDYWVSQFADAATEDRASLKKSPLPPDDIENPFPPGYAEDLLEE
ncbi:MAG: NYN domain-containing protein [Pirellulales bacterium]